MAFGTRVAFYSLTKSTGRLSPDSIPGSRTMMIDTAPIDRWVDDILTSDGARNTMAMFQSVKDDCRTIDMEME